MKTVKELTKTLYGEFSIKRLSVREEAPAQASTPEEAAKLWENGPAKSDWYDPDKECLVVFVLNTKLNCTGFFMIALGSLNECVARIAEILKPLVIANAHSFILMHNHPSGDPLPSQADIELTRRLNEASRIMGIRLQDHLVIGNPAYVAPGRQGYFSFREGGLM